MLFDIYAYDKVLGAKEVSKMSIHINLIIYEVLPELQAF